MTLDTVRTFWSPFSHKTSPVLARGDRPVAAAVRGAWLHFEQGAEPLERLVLNLNFAALQEQVLFELLSD